MPVDQQLRVFDLSLAGGLGDVNRISYSQNELHIHKTFT